MDPESPTLRTSFSLALALVASLAHAAGAKAHVVALGAVGKVVYSVIGDPAGARKDEAELRVRPLVVDGKVKEWTTGDAHDVTDRRLVVGAGGWAGSGSAAPGCSSTASAARSQQVPPTADSVPLADRFMQW